MKNKGFTLIELIAVVALLALTFLVVVPSIMNTFNKMTEEKYNRYLNDVFLAAEAYIEGNVAKYKEFIENKETFYITYEELLSSDYLKSTIYDSKNEKTVKDEDFTVEVYFLEDSDEYHYKLHERHISN